MVGFLARGVDACVTFHDVFLAKLPEHSPELRRTLQLMRWTVSAIVIGLLISVLLMTYL